MDIFLNSILDLILLAVGCIAVVITAAIIFLMISGEAETSSSIPWAIFLGISGGGLIKWSLTSIIKKDWSSK